MFEVGSGSLILGKTRKLCCTPELVAGLGLLSFVLYLLRPENPQGSTHGPSSQMQTRKEKAAVSDYRRCAAQLGIMTSAMTPVVRIRT